MYCLFVSLLIIIITLLKLTDTGVLLVAIRQIMNAIGNNILKTINDDQNLCTREDKKSFFPIETKVLMPEKII